MTVITLHPIIPICRVALDLLSSPSCPLSVNRYYVRIWKGQLINPPYVDNRYRWAGGGFISVTEDLLEM